MDSATLAFQSNPKRKRGKTFRHFPRLRVGLLETRPLCPTWRCPTRLRFKTRLVPTQARSASEDTGKTRIFLAGASGFYDFLKQSVVNMAYVVACLVVVVVPVAVFFIAWRSMIWMPGRSFRGVPAPLDETEAQVRQVLREDLTVLAQDIGERNVSRRYAQLIAAAEFIVARFRQCAVMDAVIRAGTALRLFRPTCFPRRKCCTALPERAKQMAILPTSSRFVSPFQG